MVLLILGLLLQTQRDPVPDAATQKDKEKVIRDVFKAEYARKTPSDRTAFARMLLQQALQTKDDPPTKYVMLREAREIAVQGGDAGTASEAVAEMARCFEVDALRMKLSVLTSMAQEARTPDLARNTADALLKLVDEAEAKEDVETQEKSVAVVIAVARRCKDLTLAARAESRQKEVADLKSKLTRVRSARETLLARPEDPAANLEVGQLECFYRGNWDAGLPLLAKGSSESLRTLALQDLSNPGQVQEQIQLGEAWRDRSERESGSRQRIRDRAIFWYEKAAEAATGIFKLKVDKALADLTGARLREISPQGLVAWWKLDEGAGTIADDASGHGHTGKLSGGADWAQGRLGRAIHLDGRDGHVSIPDAPLLRITGDLTLAFWLKKEAVPSEWARLVGKGDYNNRNYNISLGAAHHKDTLLFQQWDAEKRNVIELVSKYHTEIGKWVHVAGVARGEEAWLYIDGRLDNTSKRTGTPQTSADPVVIGYPGLGLPFAGLIDDVRIYARALSESEVLALASMK